MGRYVVFHVEVDVLRLLTGCYYCDSLFSVYTVLSIRPVSSAEVVKSIIALNYPLQGHNQAASGLMTVRNTKRTFLRGKSPIEILRRRLVHTSVNSIFIRRDIGGTTTSRSNMSSMLGQLANWLPQNLKNNYLSTCLNLYPL
jgi:hypothetical protein